MRKIFTLCAAALCAISTMATKGALNGKFTINAEGDQIVFSKGNLQYVGTWQFATNQWDTIGVAQSDNNRDLFGWGTGDAPNNISGSVLDYPSFTDWGVNPITNGGNVANAWRTLTGDEWYYLFYTRENAATLFALGSVNGVNGTILLPDNWVLPAGASFTASTALGLEDYGDYYINANNNNFSHNTYTAEQWIVMEAAGAVFLPVTRYRYSTTDYCAEASGIYWSATPGETTYAYCFKFGSLKLYPRYDLNPRYWGLPVRLVQAASMTSQIDEVDLTISEFPKLNETIGTNSFEASVPVDAGYVINNYSFFDDENNYLADDDYIFKVGTYVVEIGLWPEDGFAFPSNGGMADGTKIVMTINGESPYDWYGGDSGIPVLFLKAQFTLSDPTGCANVPNNDVQCTKVIRDGQLYLMYKGQMYNVQGQEVR